VADDRAAETDIDAIARLSAELADLRSTLLARVGRSATGTVEPSILPVPKPDTLFLQGQALNRADYPGLWQWVQDNGLLVAGLFTVGNNTTTFGLPDLRGRVPIGAGPLGPDNYGLGQVGGAARSALTVPQMPSHDHNVSVANHGDHDHNASTASSGGHSGHNLGSVTAASALPGYQDFAFSVAASTQNGGGGHVHGVDVFLTESTGGHRTHSVGESMVGGTDPVDLRQPFLAINWAIWT
jgi:microcystin-dependent protein